MLQVILAALTDPHDHTDPDYVLLQSAAPDAESASAFRTVGGR
ncbi:hypothetical protein PV387_39745 [Streptomyces sp. ME02-6987-2C]|nr:MULTISPECIES: hypothetical protein [unclassified Streptomyces]MDX3372054.1 hypothetical protein [Streptomyces sp. ME02-6987-2C]MDX3427172.1 hypothetical protein [Streptomyces sp. ME02-6985-2c]